MLQPLLNLLNSKTALASPRPRAILRILCYFAHQFQHLKMKENDNSENSMIKNNPKPFFSLVTNFYQNLTTIKISAKT